LAGAKPSRLGIWTFGQVNRRLARARAEKGGLSREFNQVRFPYIYTEKPRRSDQGGLQADPIYIF